MHCLARRVALSLLVASAASLFVVASPATAATTFGSDLTLAASPSTACSSFIPLATNCTTVLTGVHTGNVHSVAAPTGGVVVEVRFKTDGAESGTVRLARTSGGGKTGAGTGPEITASGPGTHEVLTRLPVVAGDFLALNGSATTAYNCPAGPAGASLEIFGPPLVDGAAGRTATAGAPCELLVQADIEADADNDGYGDETQDNCVGVANPSQANNDGDAEGDVCDADDDNDNVADAPDNCDFVANQSQANNDGDTDGDACDSNDDTDNVLDATDNCDFVANQDQANNDGDAEGDVCDADDDNDTVADASDACPTVSDAAAPRAPRTGCPADATTPGDGGPTGPSGEQVTAAAIRTALQADLNPGVKSASKLGLEKVLANGGFTIKDVDALTGGTLDVAVTGPAGVSQTSAKSAVYAKGKRTFSGAGRANLRVKLTKQGKKLLRSAKNKVTLKVTASFTAQGKPKVTVKRNLKLKRKPKKN